jgi:hypothetical protein
MSSVNQRNGKKPTGTTVIKILGVSVMEFGDSTNHPNVRELRIAEPTQKILIKRRTRKQNQMQIKRENGT